MLNKNNIQTGVLIGLMLPVLSAVVFELIMNPFWVYNHRGLPYFVVAAINLLVLRYFATKHQEKTVQGIILVTLMFLVLVYIYRYKI